MTFFSKEHEEKMNRRFTEKRKRSLEQLQDRKLDIDNSEFFNHKGTFNGHIEEDDYGEESKP